MQEKIQKIKNMLKNNKKLTIIIGSVILILIIIIITMFLMGGNERKLKKYMEEIGIDFYENLYYPQVGNTEEEKAEFLKDFSETGIKINLDGLLSYKQENREKADSLMNEKTKERCDKENSQIIIYPKDPYGSKDYKIEVKLICDGNEK